MAIAVTAYRLRVLAMRPQEMNEISKRCATQTGLKWLEAFEERNGPMDNKGRSAELYC